MFTGEVLHNIDSKGRIIIPVKYREELGEQFMITKGLDGCLFVYPKAQWEVFAAKLVNLPSNQKRTRFLQRTFISGAVECSCDKQGKVLIDPEHRIHAQLTKEVKIAGVVNHLEIWNADKWNEFMSSQKSEDDENITLEDAAESMDDFSF